MFTDNKSNLLRGMVIGLAAGAAIGFAVTPKSKDTKRTINRCIHTASSVVDGIVGLLH
ncbi:MAG: YtxH domain-containing protein [Oscillospiraceae bacterium]|jgi:gas vesicle protein|nr:YtxH domain-containing protein [Oscillospiraceae bacterium]